MNNNRENNIKCLMDTFNIDEKQVTEIYIEILHDNEAIAKKKFPDVTPQRLEEILNCYAYGKAGFILNQIHPLKETKPSLWNKNFLNWERESFWEYTHPSRR